MHVRSIKQEYLYEMILHDVSNDSKLIEIASSALSANILLECDLYIADVVMVPSGTKESVCKSKDQHVLHKLLA